MSELIDKALHTASDTRVAVIAEGAIAEVATMFTELFGDATAIVVGDQRTMTVAGDSVVQVLRAAGVRQADPYVFPGDPELYALYENCELLRDVLAPLDAVAVAVGSGTLNDIVKRASGELDRVRRPARQGAGRGRCGTRWPDLPTWPEATCRRSATSPRG